MHFDEIRNIPPAPECCVIINVATEVVSALAVASALRNADMPVLLVNCTPSPVSKTMCRVLGEQWGVDTIDISLDVHGKTLDHLFAELHFERILILDSDAEIRTPQIVTRMRSEMNAPDVFGSGWIQDYLWIDADPVNRPYPLLFVQRLYVPCAMLRTSMVRYALDHGRSFAERFTTGPGLLVTEFPSPELLSQHPHVASVFDTGAEMLHWLRAQGLKFMGPRALPETYELNHLVGVTRNTLGGDVTGGTPLNDVEQQCLVRLSQAYPDLVQGFAVAVHAAENVVALANA